MKQRAPIRGRTAVITALALAMAGLAACESTGPSDTATFEGTWANQEWSGDAWAADHEGRLTIGGTHPPNAGGLPLNTVSVVTTADAPGTYPLGPGDAEVLYLVGGDVRTATYGIPEGGSGTITIESIFRSTVTGSVMFGAVRLYSNGEPPVGEMAIFEGRFSARIQRFPSSSSMHLKPSDTGR